MGQFGCTMKMFCSKAFYLKKPVHILLVFLGPELCAHPVHHIHIYFLRTSLWWCPIAYLTIHHAQNNYLMADCFDWQLHHSCNSKHTVAASEYIHCQLYVYRKTCSLGLNAWEDTSKRTSCFKWLLSFNIKLLSLYYGNS